MTSLPLWMLHLTKWALAIECIICQYAKRALACTHHQALKLMSYRLKFWYIIKHPYKHVYGHIYTLLNHYVCNQINNHAYTNVYINVFTNVYLINILANQCISSFILYVFCKVGFWKPYITNSEVRNYEGFTH